MKGKTPPSRYIQQRGITGRRSRRRGPPYRANLITATSSEMQGSPFNPNVQHQSSTGAPTMGPTLPVETPQGTSTPHSADVGTPSALPPPTGTPRRKRGRTQQYDPGTNLQLASPGTASPSPKQGTKRTCDTGTNQQFASHGAPRKPTDPQVINIGEGQDIVAALMSVTQQMPGSILSIISACGAVSIANLHQPLALGCTMEYQEQYGIVFLSGSFTLSNSSHITGGLTVTLFGPDGTIDECVHGSLFAASPVEVRVRRYQVPAIQYPVPISSPVAAPVNSIPERVPRMLVEPQVISISEGKGRPGSMIMIVAASGAVSTVTLHEPLSLGCTMTYKGQNQRIFSLSGSLSLSNSSHITGGLTVTLIGPDGPICGCVHGQLIAASSVEVRVRCHQEPAIQYPAPISSPVAAAPVMSQRQNLTLALPAASECPEVSRSMCNIERAQGFQVEMSEGNFSPDCRTIDFLGGTSSPVAAPVMPQSQNPISALPVWEWPEFSLSMPNNAPAPVMSQSQNQTTPSLLVSEGPEVSKSIRNKPKSDSED